MKQLIRAGAAVEFRTQNGTHSVLIDAASVNAYDALVWLIYNGADPSAVHMQRVMDADGIALSIIVAASRHVAAVGYEYI